MSNLKKFFKKNRTTIVVIILLIIICVLGYFMYKKNKEYAITVENQYNFAFYELIDYVQDVQNYLAKSMISNSSENGGDTLIHVWREANLAQVYLSQLPVSSNELSNTAKFLNQVSEYSYSLASKSINNENLSQEDLDNLKKLYDYCTDLKNTLNQLSTDLQNGQISWENLTKDADLSLAQQVDNISATSFSNIDKNFGEYAGLIYDGAYSEHIENSDKKGLTGEDITEDEAKKIATDFIGNDRIKNINSNGLIENGNIQVYDFSAEIGDKNNPLNISISKKGGHIVLMNYNRNVNEEKILQDEANKIGQDFLTNHGFENMKSTYYLKQGGIVTVNYAYLQDDVTVYADLIKLKIALDDGEILGIETTGYLNNHEIRDIKTPKITKEEAKISLNPKLEITSEDMAIIPTEWRTENLCYEFKGKINETDFLVYINAETGKEENILVIINTPNGILTQ